MRIQHLLLLSTIAVAGPVLAAEPKPDGSGKTGTKGSSKSEPTGHTAAGENRIPNRSAQKDRVHYTFPPSAKRR